MTRSLTAWAPLAVAIALVPPPAAADTASQVFDLWPGSDPGVPSFDAAVFDGRLCFRGRNDFAAVDATGDELYCYDGTTVTLAADILLGGTGSFPRELTVYDGQLYFSAENPFDDNELWRWDGTNPPEEVFDLRPGGESAPRELTVYDGQLYFNADDGSTGRELWRYDSSQPTVVGTNPMLVDDIRPGLPSALETPRDWVVFDGILYFPANDSLSGEELFRFDSSQPIVSGTNPGLVVDLRPGLPPSQPGDLTVHDGNLYFTAVDVASPFQPRLFRFDGVNPPTKLSTTLDFEGDLVSYGGDLLFFALDDDPVSGTGNELWSYDGTTFTRVEPGVEYILGGPFGEIEGLLYFIAPRGNALDGFDLYKYDGSGPPAPAVALFSTLGDANYPIFGFQVFDGLLYFNARTTAGGAELWALEAEGGGPPPSGVIQFSSAAYAVGEGDGLATITFLRTGGSEGPIGACFRAVAGTATSADFTPVDTTVLWGPGDATPLIRTVPIIDDADVVGPVTVNLSLYLDGFLCSGPLGTPTQAILTILDDDGLAGPLEIPTVSEWGLLLLAAALALLALPRLRG